MNITDLGYRIEEGAGGIKRCAFDRDVAPADDPRVLHRRRSCTECDRVGKVFGVPVLCGVCKCVLKCSTRIPEKGCPHPVRARFGPFQL